MEFGWINIFGAVFVILMLIPNIVYAINNKGGKNLCTNRVMNLIEQIGRYACIVLMWLPLLVWKFGFASVFEMMLYLIGNGILLIVYWVVFAFYRLLVWQGCKRINSDAFFAPLDHAY